MAPPETPPGSHVAQSSSDTQEGAGKHSSDRAGSIVPEKGEPHGVSYIKLKIINNVKVEITQNKGKERQNSYQKLKRSP